MCVLRLGLRPIGGSWELEFPCDAEPVATAWTEALARNFPWPVDDVARLELDAGEPPLVVRLDDLFLAQVERCDARREEMGAAPRTTSSSELSPEKETA